MKKTEESAHVVTFHIDDPGQQKQLLFERSATRDRVWISIHRMENETEYWTDERGDFSEESVGVSVQEMTTVLYEILQRLPQEQVDALLQRLCPAQVHDKK